MAAALLVPLLIYGLFLAIVVWGIANCTYDCCARPYPFTPAYLQPDDSWTFVKGVAIAGVAYALFLVFARKRDRGTALAEIALLLVVFLTVGMALYGIGRVTRPPETVLANHTVWYVLANYAAASAFIMLVSFMFTENANSLHRLYRDRLNNAFRLGDRANGRGSLFLKNLHDKAPYLLVNGALNVRQASKAAVAAKDEAAT